MSDSLRRYAPLLAILIYALFTAWLTWPALGNLGAAIPGNEGDAFVHLWTYDWVKDALSHYWGGPKLTKSPLIELQIVKQAMDEHNGVSTNALRSILKQGIERVRPEGERRFTAEWILYNILELKFMEGRRVREVALRLAVSEADLYRKQRVAIEAVANAILEMERQALDQKNMAVDLDPANINAN